MRLPLATPTSAMYSASAEPIASLSAVQSAASVHTGRTGVRGSPVPTMNVWIGLS